MSAKCGTWGHSPSGCCEEEIASLRARLALLEAVADAARVVVNNFGIPNGNGPWAANPHLKALHTALSSVPQ